MPQRCSNLLVASFVVLCILSPISNGQRFANVGMTGGAWDERGYLPFEVTGPIPTGLRKSVDLVRTGRAGEAWTAVERYCLENPRSYHGIKLLAESAKRLNRSRAVFERFKLRCQRERPQLWDHYGLLASGYTLGWNVSASERQMITKSNQVLWQNRKESIALGILSAVIRRETERYDIMRDRATYLVRGNPGIPELRLLQAVNYAAGYYVVRLTPAPDPKFKLLSNEPMYPKAHEILKSLRKSHPRWGVLVFLQGSYTAAQHKPDEATELFRRYLAFNPPASSRESRKAKAYLSNPVLTSLWLAEDLEAYGIEPKR